MEPQVTMISEGSAFPAVAAVVKHSTRLNKRAMLVKFFMTR